ncbi:MAG: 50S ribosomal protein L23 [bacterium]|nr:50S ribosomal protein L23 [bacterium]
MIIQKAINTEKSYKAQDGHGTYTFLVNPKANKSEIKQEVERMFGVTVVGITTSTIRPKFRDLRKYIHTKRSLGKRARVTLKDRAKLDLTKLKK